MQTKWIIAIFIVIIFSAIGFAQKQSPCVLAGHPATSGQGESWRYMGKTPPGKAAELFAPEIIKHLAHSSPTFTPDGKEIYWSTTSGENETRKIYYTKYENNKWSPSIVAPFSGNYHDDHPFISYDGKNLFFASKRPKEPSGSQENDIWIADKIEQGWSEPKPINNFIGLWTPTVTRTRQGILTGQGTLYFLDIADGFKRNCGIFRSEFINGAYSTPELLPEQINQKDSLDWCPFIAADESYLIFSSDREGGYGSGDLYISFKEKNGNWRKAINMGAAINTDKQERFPGVSPDGKYLFFTRWHSEPNFHDLYWLDAGIINDLRNSEQK
ncbi:MAG: hypothetical protein E4H23_04300 [Chrysiogenales bacterium]|nr:MAG: hypothetical protein E4H23_04300 [Chrysiogenales bacterium]